MITIIRRQKVWTRFNLNNRHQFSSSTWLTDSILNLTQATLPPPPFMNSKSNKIDNQNSNHFSQHLQIIKFAIG